VERKQGEISALLQGVAVEYFGGTLTVYRLAYPRNVERALCFVAGTLLIGNHYEPMAWYINVWFVAFMALLFGGTLTFAEVGLIRPATTWIRGIIAKRPSPPRSKKGGRNA
jgi:hypothetical protein